MSEDVETRLEWFGSEIGVERGRSPWYSYIDQGSGQLLKFVHGWDHEMP